MFICWQQKIELQNVSILGGMDAKIDKYEDPGKRVCVATAKIASFIPVKLDMTTPLVLLVIKRGLFSSFSP